MKSCNNQTVQDKKMRNYTKKIIGCAFVIACVTNSASAMFSRAVKEGYGTLRSTSVRTIFAHSCKPAAEGVMPSISFAARYHVEAPLSDVDQRDIVIKEISSLIPASRMNEIIKSLASKRIDANTINVVKTLYGQEKLFLDLTLMKNNQESTYTPSMTGC